tara:strand:+ start:1475 stop:1942 length:468 start_codon:yes stop_codon:yes gene_type:complete
MLEENLRYLLCDRGLELFQNGDLDSEHLREMGDLFGYNIDSYAKFSNNLKIKRLIDKKRYDVFRHFYLGNQNGIRSWIGGLSRGYYKKNMNKFFDGVYGLFDTLEVVRLPMIFGFIRQLSEENDIEYENLLREFEESWDDFKTEHMERSLGGEII